MPRIPRFLRLPRRTARIRAEIDEEIRFDIEMRAADLIRGGLTPREAAERAAREFGDLEVTRRYCEEIDMQIEAESRRRHLLDDFRADLMIALRGIRRAPVFAAVVLLTLALGIGANTAVFSVVRRVLVTPLPFRAPEQLYRLYTSPSSTGDFDKLSSVELTALAEQSRMVAGVTWFGNYAGGIYADDRTAESWLTVWVAPNFFSVFGIAPAVGRAFTAADFAAGAPATGMITYPVWVRFFGADRNIAGKVIQFAGRPLTVVGVLPQGFVGPTFNAEMLLPADLVSVSRSPRSRVWRSVARLKPGISLERWRPELEVVRSRIQAAYPEIKNAGVFLPMPLHEAVVGGAGSVLRFVMGGALIVLLAACVNIAGLFLSRAVGRQREIGVRTALGAGRGRLVRQMVAETLVYGLLGGALGILLAFAMKAALLQQFGPMLPQLGDVRIDVGVLAFALMASVGSGVAFAVLPALGATRVDVREALGDGGMRAVSRGSSAARASRILVSAQVACAVVLVVGAGLLIRTFRTLTDVDVGYETSAHIATFSAGFGARYREPSEQRAFLQTLLARLHAIPGVTAAGYTITTPWSGVWRSVRFRPSGASDADAAALPSVALASSSNEFFAAAGIRVLDGRGFTAQDQPGSARTAVISESMARRFWPNSSPIGALIRVDLRSDSGAPREIVGVVTDVREDAISDPTPTLYVPAEQLGYYSGTFIVRTSGDGKALLGLIRATVRDIDSHIPVTRERTLDEVRSDLVRRQRVAMTLIAMFAALAVFLAGLGTYGIMAYGVASRTREFGIRTALGASRPAILALVLRDGFTVTLAGIVVGGLVAVAASRAVAALLYGVTTTDPVSYVGAIILLLAIAVVACLLPARAATRVEPVEALRIE